MFGAVRRHPFVTTVTLVGALATGVAVRSPRLDPAGWEPPEPPALEGPLAPNQELADCATVVTGPGPEDAAFDDEGRLYTGLEDGTVRRTTDPVEGRTDLSLERFADTGGRPLALEFSGEQLLVCDRDRGLVAVDHSGESRLLVGRCDGRELGFADDLHVADGTVYFTDATVHDRFREEFVELRDTGRLLAHDLETGETRVELEGLGFANGIEPGPEGESLLVTETSRYRVTRYYHRGERAGETEAVLENLPGFPDNIDAAGDGTYWLAIPSRRDAFIDWLHRHPAIARQVGKLPPRALDAVPISPYGLVLRVGADGTVLESLHDPGGEGGVHGVTSATPHEGALYLGTLFGERLVRYPME
jgi:sugar lactone lactonase YvrE